MIRADEMIDNNNLYGEAMSLTVQVFGRRHDEAIDALMRPATENLHRNGSLLASTPRTDLRRKRSFLSSGQSAGTDLR